MIIMRLLAQLRAWVKKLIPASPSRDTVQDNTPPLQKREIILAATACLVLLAVVAGALAWYVQSRDSGQSSAKQDARGYTLTPPEGWTQVSPTPEGSSVAFALPSTDGSGSSRVFIAVQSTALNSQAQKLAFEAISESYVAQLSKSYEDFKVAAIRSVRLGGAPATLVNFSYSSAMSNQTAQSLFTVKNGISYTVNGEAPTDQWQGHAAQIEQALLTFRP